MNASKTITHNCKFYANAVKLNLVYLTTGSNSGDAIEFDVLESLA